MIYIHYSREAHSVSLYGHADSGEAGHDLVCAAASILAYTLACYVRTLQETDQVSVDLLSGDTSISCTPPAEKSEEIAKIFDAICNGFALLAKHYPDNVCFVKK